MILPVDFQLSRTRNFVLHCKCSLLSSTSGLLPLWHHKNVIALSEDIEVTLQEHIGSAAKAIHEDAIGVRADCGESSHPDLTGDVPSFVDIDEFSYYFGNPALLSPAIGSCDVYGFH